MNNENKPSVIAELTAALASMAERAAAAEAEAEQYKKSSGNQDKTQLPPSLRHSGEENRRQHHETGRRHTAGLSESLRQ